MNRIKFYEYSHSNFNWIFFELVKNYRKRWLKIDEIVIYITEVDVPMPRAISIRYYRTLEASEIFTLN